MFTVLSLVCETRLSSFDTKNELFYYSQVSRLHFEFNKVSTEYHFGLQWVVYNLHRNHFQQCLSTTDALQFSENIIEQVAKPVLRRCVDTSERQ